MDVETEMVYADILRTLQNSILNTSVSCYNFLSIEHKPRNIIFHHKMFRNVQILVCPL